MPNPRSLRLLALGLALVLAVPGASSAQDLARLLVDRLVNGIDSDVGVTPGLPNLDHRAHWELRESASVVFLNAGLFNQALSTQLSNIPVGASAGGFTYEFDAATGTFTRSSESFGPSLAERALTQGRRKLSLGASFQHSHYDSFEGEDLEDGAIRFNLEHSNCCPGGSDTRQFDESKNPFFEGDLLEAAVAIDPNTDTMLVFANYGLTDRLDLGLVVPFSRVELDVDTIATIIPLSTEAQPTIHRFDGANSKQKTFHDGGSESGIGDVALRAKWNFLRRSGGGLAAGLEVRLPTGDEDNLLGAGVASGRFALIGSAAFGRLSPHVNLGYRVSGEEDQAIQVEDRELDLAATGVELYPDEVSFAAGVDVAVTPRFTVAADVLERSFIDAGRLRTRTRTYTFKRANAAPLESAERDGVELEEGNLDQVTGAVGVKLNLAKSLLVSGNVLFRLNHQGLRDDVTPLFGLDYTF